MMPGAGILWARTVPAMNEILSHERVWDLVLLDHDIGQRENGTDAARQIRAIGPIVVWSLNHERAPGMVEILEARELHVIGWRPFGSPELVQTLRDVQRGRFGAAAV